MTEQNTTQSDEENESNTDDYTLPIKRVTGDTLEERLTGNAYHNILPARYLKKDEEGDLVESQEDLFKRIGQNVALAEAVYELERQGEELTVTPDQIKPTHHARGRLAGEVFGIDSTDFSEADELPKSIDDARDHLDSTETTLTENNVNKFAYETLIDELPDDIASYVENIAEEYTEMHESLKFVANSPTLMNAGDDLQQLSACFVNSPDDDMDDIHETAREAAKTFKCLTDDATVFEKTKGLISVAEVSESDKILQRTENGFQYKPVTETHEYDDAETITVTLENGMTIRGTPNHELEINGGWTRLDEAEEGDVLSYSIGWIEDIDSSSPILATVDEGAQWGSNRKVSNTEIMELYHEGLSDYEMADELGVGKSTIQRRRANELNLPPNGQGGRVNASTEFNEDEAIELIEMGNTDSQVATEMGVSKAAIQTFRTKEDIEANGTAVKSVTQPQYMSVDLAELVGLWAGDGSYHTDGIRFHIGREEIVSWVETTVSELFDTTVSKHYSDGCYEVCINSHEIKRWWKANFDVKSDGAQNVTTPAVITQSTPAEIKGYLRGYFSADGAVTDGHYPVVYSSSEDCIDQLSTLLMGLNMPVKKSVIRNDEENPYYSVTVTTQHGRKTFQNEIGFLDSREVAPVENPRDTSYDGETNWTVEITSVTKTGPDTVYDVTVDDTHQYITDGIVSHNSGGGMGYAFWKLRPKGDPVGSSGGVSSGPITFMNTFDQMCETVAQGGCVYNGERIMTDTGYIPFGEIHQGSTLTDAPSRRTVFGRDGEMHSVRQTVDSGPMDTVTIHTTEGYKLTVTPNHPVLAIQSGFPEWTPAGDLNQVETVVLPAFDKTTTHREPLEDLEKSNRHFNEHTTIQTPNTVTDDFAKFIGLLWGDGAFDDKNNRLVFTLGKNGAADQNALPFLKNYLDSLEINYTVTDESQRDKGECYRIEINSTYFTEWLLLNDIDKQSDNLSKIPEIIYRSPAAIPAFLGGLTCDASINTDAHTVTYSTAQHAFASEIQDLLLTVGITAKVTKHPPQEDRHSDKESYRIRITPGNGYEKFNSKTPHFFTGTNFENGGERQNQITFAPTRVETLLDEHFDKNCKLPNSVDAKSMKELRRYERGDRTPSKARLTELLEQVNIPIPEFLQQDLYFATIKEVTDSGTQMVSDIEVFVGEPEFFASKLSVLFTRRGAQMGVMRVSHPDVLEFIHSKNKDVSLAHTLRLNDPDDYTHTDFIDAVNEARELIDDQGRVPEHLRNAVEGHLSNFNISVGITDDFMDAVKNDDDFTFTNPRTGEPHITTEQTAELYEMFGYGEYVEVGEELSVPAREIWNDIIAGAHENGEPGVIYLERANKKHSFDVEEHPDHQILATNPCVAEGTLVNTPDGYERVENISEGDEVSTVIGSEPVDEIETHDNKEVYRVRFSDGSSIEVTEDHMFNLLDGKEVIDSVRLKDVDVGDTVRLEPTPMRVEGDKDDYMRQLKRGILLGDGCYSPKTLDRHNIVKIASNEDDVEYNESIQNDIFADNEFNQTDTSGDGKGVNFVLKNGQDIVDSLDLTPAKSHGKDFDVTEITSKQEALGLLDGLLASDGNVNLNSTHPQIRWDTSSYEMAQSIRHALLLLGLHGRISISDKADRGGVIDDRKITANYDKHTVQISGSSAGKYAELSRVGAFHTQKGQQLVELQTNWMTTGNTWKAQIEEISPVDETTTVYDLYCKESDTWVTSGYVSRGCGEQPLEEYEACNLGHINFSTLVSENPEFQDYREFRDVNEGEYASEEEAVEAFLEQAIDWDEFNYRIEYGTRFLEDVVTMSDFPIDKIEEKVSNMRKIGLGIMGYAQLLVQLGIQYGSTPANEVARQMMTHMNHESKKVSHRLAVSDEEGMDRGVFSEWDKSKYADPDEYEEWFEHHTGEDASEWSEGYPLRNHNTSTIAPTGCVAEETLVSTTDGLSEIGDLEAEDAISYGQWSDTEGEVATVTDTGVEDVGGVYDNSLADVKTITTEQGFTVSSTPNHRFRVFTDDGEYEWKEACEFEDGDNIVLIRNTFSESSPAELDVSELDTRHHNTDESLRLPGEMTDELAEFLGYYMGDGYVHNGNSVKLVVDSRESELEERLVELSESIFGVTPTVEDRGTRRILCVGGRHLPRFFEDNGWRKERGNTGEGAASAFVPSEVRSSEESHLRRFLGGLFEADGTASRKVELSTVSEDLASQVQTSLLSLGIVFVEETYDADDLDGHYGDRTQYRLRGANKREDVRFAEEVGFMTKELDVELSAQSYKNDTYPPAVAEYVTSMDGFTELPGDVKKRVRAAQWNGSLSRKAIQEVEKRLGDIVTVDGRVLTDLYIAEVSSVVDDMAYTRDMEVPSTNTYTANGFVSHNTTSMVGNTTGGCEPMYNVAYMKNVSDDVQGDEMLVEFDDYFLRVLEENDIAVEPVKREAQELMQDNEFEGAQDLETVPDEIAELFITTSEISGLEHASVQCAFQDGVDSSISKTCNLPKEASREDMREVYEYIYENGGKGVTVYRDGTRSKQVLTTRADNAEFSDDEEFSEFLTQQVEDGVVSVDDVIDTLQEEFDVRASMDSSGQLGLSEYRKRPDSLVGINQRVNTGYGTLYVWISEDVNGNMFEVFASIGKAGGYTQSFTEGLCRMISMSLRYGVPPQRIVKHLSGIQSPKVAWENQEQVSSVADGIAMAMDEYLEHGGVVGMLSKLRAGDDDLAERLEGGQPPADMDVEQLRGDVDDAVEGDFEEGDAVSLGGKDEFGSEPAVDEVDEGVDSGASGDATQELVAQGESPECPECGAMQLYYSEGCKTCEACGWSEC